MQQHLQIEVSVCGRGGRYQSIMSAPKHLWQICYGVKPIWAALSEHTREMEQLGYVYYIPPAFKRASFIHSNN